MALYSIISVLAAIVMSCIGMTIFSKFKLLRKDSVFIISFSSIVIALSFPLILKGFISVGTSISFNLALFTSIITCLSLVTIISAAITYREYLKEKGKVILNWDMSFIKNRLKGISRFIENVFPEKAILLWRKLIVAGNNKRGKVLDAVQNTDTIGIEDFNNDDIYLYDSTESQEPKETDEFCRWDADNPEGNCGLDSLEAVSDSEGFDFVFNCEDYVDEEVLKESLIFENEFGSGSQNSAEEPEEDIYDSVFYGDDSFDFIKDDPDEYSDYKYLEESINRVINEIVPNDNNLAIDEIIDEGFRLKEKGDYEGAIINFLYALDRRPADDVARWIVLDICVMYKQLGQVDLAREVLDSYLTEYGIEMDDALKSEIELNLK